jgi:hypothetical protein
MNNRLIVEPISALNLRRSGVLGAGQTLNSSSINLVLLTIGSFIHMVAEASLLPMVTALIYYCAGWTALWLPKLGRVWERHIYNRVFSVGFLVAGVSALYRNFWGDNLVDATAFFEIASGEGSGLSITEIAVFTEGSLAVIIWREIFDLMAVIGFPRDQYIGVLVNVLIVALSSVIAIKIVQQIYGFDISRFKMLVLMYSFCGMFWIFSGIFIRDSIILLGVNLLVSAWVYFLNKPGFGLRLIMAVFYSILASTLFGFMRSEFVFVPISIATAAIAAVIFGQKRGFNKSRLYLLLALSMVVIGIAFVIFGEAFKLALALGKEGYLEQATSTSNDDSLGMALIVNQPMPIRLVLGSVYLYIFPIPLWSGFQLESSYHLFKSLNVIFMCFLLPLLLLAFYTTWKNKLFRTRSMMFMLFLVIGFTFAIAGTSLETRHLGVFFVPIFILALLPNMENAIVRGNYRQILYVVISMMLLVHFAWLFLKFGFLVVIVFTLMILIAISFIAHSKIIRYICMILSLLLTGYIFL